MPSLHKKRIGRNVYWYARECRRIDGKPKIVWQQYLGRADDILGAVQRFQQETVAPTPHEVRTAEFGASAALYDLLSELEVIGSIDRHVPKRGRGPTVGQYLSIAVINRCLAPVSKAKIAEWFARSVLSRLIPLEPRQLSSQRFWDNMNRVSEDSIRSIEQELTARCVKKFELDIKHVLFDATNFFTFIDTFNERSKLAQRGKCKEGRMALRIVGLALLVTADFHIPLFHHTYPGNQPDAPTFASLTEQLMERYRRISSETEHVTLVFDKGNNSKDNLAAVDKSPFHFVGSLVHTQLPEVLEIPLTEFRSLESEGLEGVRTYRTTKKVLGVLRTVVVTYNENFFKVQSRTVMREVAKRLQKLGELEQQLGRWRDGSIRSGSRPTVATVTKKVDSWLKAQHMRRLIQVHVKDENGTPSLTYQFDQDAWEKLQHTVLGKTILFTDNVDWTDVQIVRAYRGQAKVEEAFRCMKDTDHLALRPTNHWTDQKVRVQVFICVLALMLASLLQRELDRRGVRISIHRMLDLLEGIQECTVVYSRVGKDPILRTLLSTMSDEQRTLYKTLDLKRFTLA